jgi:hypothetical protein
MYWRFRGTCYLNYEIPLKHQYIYTRLYVTISNVNNLNKTAWELMEFSSHTFAFTCLYILNINNTIVNSKLSVIKYFLSEEIREGQVGICFSGWKINSNSGVHKYWAPGLLDDYFRTVAPNICASSVWNLLHVTIQTTRILRWLLDFWKICAPMQWLL